MAVLAVALLVVETTAPAFAQQRERTTLLELLFGRRQAPQIREAPPQPVRKSTPKVRARKTTKSVTSIRTVPKAPPAVEKVENARKILVVGDFFAGALADGLKEAFAESPGVVIVESSKGSSGLVRQDYYDWPSALPALIDDQKPALVVVAIGANDRQTITTASSEIPFRTDAWLNSYEQRVAELSAIVTKRNVPLMWVGLPSFSSSKMTADAITLNSIYRNTVTKVGGEFIDIWDGFVDVEGRFIVTGSDIKGQQVRLRGPDGIGMTPAGKRKMAFYAEKPLRRLLGDMASPDLLRLDESNLPSLVELPPSEMQNLVHTRPIDLSDPDLDGSTELLGLSSLSSSPIPTPRDLLVEKGEMSPAPTGRVDDYRLAKTVDAKKNGEP